MRIPLYIQDIMSRSVFDRDFKNPHSSPGYTIRIKKATPYTYASTFQNECERLVRWARFYCADAEILECPTKTRHGNQYALVTVTDPCMLYLEKYMKENA